MIKLRWPSLSFVLGRIPIRVRPSFLLPVLAGASFGRSGLEAAVLGAGVAVSLLVHELGHALAVRGFQAQPAVELHALGGTTSWPAGAELTPRQRGMVAVAGPLASFALGIGVWATYAVGRPFYGLPKHLIDTLFLSTVGWGSVNVLPLVPLDFGALVTAGLERDRPRPGRAFRIFAGASALLWIAFAGLGENFLPLALGCGALAVGATVALRQSFAPRPLPPPAAPEHSLLGMAGMLLHQGQSDQAIGVIERVLFSGPPEAVRAQAQDLLVEAYLAKHDGQAALEVLLGLSDSLAVSLPNRAWALVQSGWADVALEWLEADFARAKSPHTAHVLLEALRELGRLDEAVARVRGPVGEMSCPEGLLGVALAALRAGRLEDCAAVCRSAWTRAPSAELAYAACRALARLGQLAEAVEWFGRAVEAGFTSARRAAIDPELEALRDLPDFIALYAKLEQPAPEEKDFSGWTLPRLGSRAGAARPTRLAAVPAALPGRLPVLPLRHAALLPGEIALVPVVAAAGVRAVNAAEENGGLIAVASHQTFAREPVGADLLEIGVVARIRRQAWLGADGWVLELEGLTRLRLHRFVADEKNLLADVVHFDEELASDVAREEVAALAQAAQALLPGIAEAPSGIGERMTAAAGTRVLADVVAAALALPLHQKLAVLGTMDATARLRQVRELLSRRARELAAIPPSRCPCCAWVPPPEARWVCGCGRAFHVFEALGHCHGCGYRAPLTECPRCQAPSLHEDWYLPVGRRGAGLG